MATQTLPPGVATLKYAPKDIKQSLSGTIGNASDNVYNSAAKLNSSASTFDKDTAAFAKSFVPTIDNINNFFNNVDTDIDGINSKVNEFYGSILTTVHAQTSGFSSHVGAIIGGLDGVVRDPLNPKNLSNMATAIMESVSPGSSKTLNNSMQNLHLDKLSKAPSLLFSSIQHLARAIDNILAIPIAFMSSIYNGLINLMRKIGKLINDLVQGFQQFILDFLDDLTGGVLKQVQQLLSDIGALAGQIQGIASVFGGVNNISQYTLQVNTFTTQINSAISNPLDTVIQYLPTNVSNGASQIIYTLDNPQTLINQFLPPQLSQLFAKVSLVTGYGFNGNMGYGFASVLQGLQGGVISGILDKFAAQYNILGPLLGQGAQPQPKNYTPQTDNGYKYGHRYSFTPNPEPYAAAPGTQQTFRGKPAD